MARLGADKRGRKDKKARKIEEDPVLSALNAVKDCGFRSLNDFLLSYFTSIHGAQSLRVQPDASYGPAAILDSWCSCVPASARDTLHSVIVEKATEIIVAEVRRASTDKTLNIQAKDKKLGPLLTALLSNDGNTTSHPETQPTSFTVEGAGFEKFTKFYHTKMPHFTALLESVLKDRNEYERWRKRNKRGKEKKAEKISTSIISQMLFVRNQGTNAFQVIMGLFLASSGASRRIMENLNHLGLSMSYATVQRLLEQLTVVATRQAITAVKSARVPAIAYDNINFTYRKSSQRLDSSTQQLNATTLAVFLLPKSFNLTKYASALSISEYQRRRGRRVNLRYEDIVPKQQSHEDARLAFKNAIRFILLDYMPGWQKRKKSRNLQKYAHQQRPHIRVLSSEKTEFFPLPALNEEEASVPGTIRVVEKIFTEELGLPKDVVSQVMRFMVGDWLSIRNLRLMKDERADEESSYHRFDWLEEASMPFHFSINAMASLVRVHFGSIKQDDPACLEHHRSILRRAKLDPKKPEYNKARELVTHSLISRLLDCTRIVLGFPHIDSLKTWSPTPHQFDNIVNQVFEKFTSTAAADRALNDDDEVLAHSILFNRDALFFWVFQDAVRQADVGQMWMVYDFWIFMMRGAGCNNYGNELLTMKSKHTLEYSPALSEIIERTWLVNRWGKPGRSIPTDLYIEHNNGFIKNMFAAMGSGASIQHIQKKASANVEILRTLAHTVSDWFGVADYNRRHKEVSTRADIRALCLDLAEHLVHTLKRNRTIPLPETAKKGKSTKQKQRAIKDVLEEGRHKLVVQGLFEKWKKRSMYEGDEEEELLSSDEEPEELDDLDPEHPLSDPNVQMDVDVHLDPNFVDNIFSAEDRNGSVHVEEDK